MEIWQQLSLILNQKICHRRREPKAFNYHKDKGIVSDLKFILRNGRDMLKCVQVEADYFYFRGKLNMKSVCMKKALSDVVKNLEAEAEYAQRMQTLKMTKVGQIQFDVYTLMNEALESLTQTMMAAREKCRDALEKLAVEQLEWNEAKMKRKEDAANAKILNEVQDDLDRELRDLNAFYSLLQNAPRDEAMEKDLQENYLYVVYLDGILERILKQRVKLTSAPLALHIYKELFGNWRRKLKRVKPDKFSFGLQESNLLCTIIKQPQKYELEMLKQKIGPESAL